MKRMNALRVLSATALASLAACGIAQRIGPARSFAPPPWQGGTAVAFLPSLHPDTVDGWSVRAIVEPVSPPVVVHLATRRGKTNEAGETALLSLEVRAVGAGLETGRTYRVLLPLDPLARRSNAKRLLLLGYRTDANGRLRVQSQSRLERLMGEPGTTAEVGENTLFAGAMIPTEARGLASGGDPLAAAYRCILDTLKDAPDSVVRGVTDSLERIPETDSPVAPHIEGGSAARWIRTTFSAGLAALPRSAPLQRLRYDGLLASWDRSRLALAYLRGLPKLLAEAGLDPSLGPFHAQTAPDARDDQEFVGLLNLYEGVDADALFDALWNSPLRAATIDPRVTRAPSVANQRRVAQTFFDDPSPDVRAEAYRRLADWNADWDHLAVSNSRWSDAANGEVIENEAAIRAFWEDKLLGRRKP